MHWRLIISYFWTIVLLTCICDDDDTIGYNGMVNSCHYLAAEAGRNILAKGGTAADAAVAVQMVLNVVQPYSSGIGGGAFVMYYEAETAQMVAIDGREEAPTAFNAYVFCSNITCFNTNGEADICSDCDTIPFSERRTGGLSVGVPGTLYAFTRLWQLYGKGEDVIAWSDLFSDAIDLGANGFPMYQAFVDTVGYYIPYLSRYDAACKLWLNYPDCTQPKYSAGDTAYNQDLAAFFATLSSMTSTEAIASFYEGAIASDIVSQVRSATNEMTGRSGLITEEDMAGYRAVFREPISNTYTFGADGTEYEAYGMNMPSSGPLTVQYQLKMLQYLQTELDVPEFSEDPYSAEALHYLLAASNIAFADRNQYMADADFVNVPLEGMQDAQYLTQRARDYLTQTVQDLPVPFGYPTGWNDTAQSDTTEGGTSHITIVDNDGNVASITTTIESGFGSFVVLDGSGFFLNNELTDFSAQGSVNGVKVANGPQGGKVQRSTAINLFDLNDDATFGGKRPRSSMAPTIVLADGSPYMALGARGGSTIIGTTFNIIAKHLVQRMGIQEAVHSAKVWGLNNAYVVFEKTLWEETNGNITQDMVDGFGYNELAFMDRSFGSASAIVIAEDGVLLCGADTTRRSTAACAAVCSDLKSSCIDITPPDTTTAAPVPTAKDSKDGNNTWMVIAIVFICLFSVSVILIVCVWIAKRRDEQNEKEEAIHQANEETTELATAQGQALTQDHD